MSDPKQGYKDDKSTYKGPGLDLGYGYTYTADGKIIYGNGKSSPAAVNKAKKPTYTDTSRITGIDAASNKNKYQDTTTLGGIAKASGSVAAAKQKAAMTNKPKAAAKPKPKPAAKKPTTTKKPTSKPSTSKGGSGVSGATGSTSGTGSTSSGSKSSSSSKPVTDKTDYLKKAQEAVKLELQPQLDAIKQAMDKLTAQADQSTAAATTRGANTQSDLSEVYSRLDAYLKDRQAVGQEGYDQTKQAVDQNYAQQQEKMQTNSVDANSQVAQELARLGIASPNQDYTQRMKADDSFLAGLAGSNRAQAASSLGAQQANAGNIAALLQGNSQASGTQQKGAATANLAQTINDIMNQRNQGVNDYNSQIAGIQGKSGAMVQQLLDAYESQAYQRQQDAQQQDFENSIASGNLDFKYQQLNSQNQYNATKAKIENAKIQAQKEIAAAKNSGAKTADGNNLGLFSKGSNGAKAYIAKIFPGDTATQALFAGAMALVDQNTDPNKYNQADYKTAFQPALGEAARYLAEHGNANTAVNSQYLSDMLKVYWGQYGG